MSKVLFKVQNDDATFTFYDNGVYLLKTDGCEIWMNYEIHGEMLHYKPLKGNWATNYGSFGREVVRLYNDAVVESALFDED